MATVTTSVARIAAAGVAAIAAGLLIPHAMKRGLDVSAPVWLVLAICIGLVVGDSGAPSWRRAVQRALMLSAVLTMVFAGVWVVRFLAEYAQNTAQIPSFGPRPGGKPLDTSEPRVQVLLAAFLFLFFLATALVVTLASLGKCLLVRGVSEVYRFGPEGFKRIEKILETLGVAIAAAVSVWSLLK